MNSAGRVISRVTCNVESFYYSVHVLANLFQLYILVSYNTVDVKEQTLDDYTAILFQYAP